MTKQRPSQESKNTASNAPHPVTIIPPNWEDFAGRDAPVVTVFMPRQIIMTAGY
jgi:phosphoribosylcarboxyaminoimidazole (NCAIR) mutase